MGMGASYPRVSIVTPSLNAAPFIERTLASVRNQIYQCLEHIVVDHYSTDGTLDILQRAAPPVRLVMDRGRGIARALNVAFGLVEGDVVGWLNADDLYLPRTLERIAAVFAGDPTIAVVYGDCLFVDLDDHIRWTQRTGDLSHERLLRQGNVVPQPAVFVRRDALRRAGPMDESLRFALDFDLWLRLIREHHFHYVPEPLACFRWHRTSLTASHGFGSWREAIRVVRKHGGGVTPALAFAYLRFLLTVTRQRFVPFLRTARDA
jgi:glycosyltransferase involved in cell wall biosynthesis